MRVSSVDTHQTPTELSVVSEVEPIVARSLKLIDAQVLNLDVALDRFKPQLDLPVSPTALKQRMPQINHRNISG